MNSGLIIPKYVIPEGVMLLVESKRPKKLRDVIGQDEAISRLESYASNPWDTPHMILSGPPGCGKTSAIHAWAKQVYGVDKKKYSVKSINTSGERSVVSVIQKIHDACRYIHESRGTKGLVICDEADSLTSEAQEVMAYCIRRYEARWIFVFIMNQPSRINRRLMGMCVHIPFKSLGNLSTIIRDLTAEYSLTDDDITRLISFYNGDLRKILNAVQGTRYESDMFIPEWKGDSTRNTITSLSNRIQEKCVEPFAHSAIMTSAKVKEMRPLFEIAISLHRPGSANPYWYAINELF